MSETDKVITWEELRKHTLKSDCWVLIEGGVYDVTTYFAEHPGGDDILMRYSGKDATKKFQDIGHSDYACSLRDVRKVGVIEKNEPPKAYKEWEEKFWKANKSISWDEVQKHNNIKDLWIVIENQVYDVTKYVESHPGGAEVLLKRAGKDATQQFKQAPHNKGLALRDEYKIGKIAQGSVAPVEAEPSSGLRRLIFVLVGMFLAMAYQHFTKQK